MSTGGGSRDRLHAGAWWVWALLLAAAASRTTNPFLLGLVVAVTGYVTVHCRDDSPWATAYGGFLRLALVVLAIRVAFHVLLGGVTGPTIWFELPEVPLPDWAAGIRLGGPVSAEGVVNTLYDAARLAAILLCVGAANSLADPRRLLASLPAALYEVSVAVVVGLTTAPQLVSSTTRIRRAHELRGGTPRGWRRIRSVLAPVIEDSVARSLDLAATMDSRGYGRTGDVDRRTRRVTNAVVLAALVGIGVGTYGLLDPDTPSALRLPPLLLGAVAAGAGLWLGSRRVPRTRYRPDRWGARESVVAVGGLLGLLGTLLAEHLGSGDLVPAFVPLTLPAVPVPAALGILCGLSPLLVARRDPEPASGTTEARATGYPAPRQAVLR